VVGRSWKSVHPSPEAVKELGDGDAGEGFLPRALEKKVNAM
jgi:hypothetical protein